MAEGTGRGEALHSQQPSKSPAHRQQTRQHPAGSCRQSLADKACGYPFGAVEKGQEVVVGFLLLALQLAAGVSSSCT